MELNRAELKGFAKQLLHRNYWPMVIAGLVLAIATGAIALNNGGASAASETSESISFMEGFMVLIISVASFLFCIFVMHPLEFGGARFFVKNIDGEGSGALFSGFESANFTRSVSTLLYRDIITFLFGLLLIIPGIIKKYEYYFVPQLLSDHPELSGKDVCELSRAMTNGRKMELFKLDLSFILWAIATSLTYGLVGVFYYFPYRYQTIAFAYRQLVEEGADPTRPFTAPVQQ